MLDDYRVDSNPVSIEMGVQFCSLCCPHCGSRVKHPRGGRWSKCPCCCRKVYCPYGCRCRMNEAPSCE